MKRVVVYYSYSGNTEYIANIIKEELNCDILKIETTKPYSTDYDTVVDLAKEEINSGYMPEIKPIDISQYDEIILGTPVWWYTYATPLNTFIKNNDFTGKTIVPFITNGGWLGHTLEDIKNNTNAKIVKPIDLKFDGSNLRDKNSFDKWLKELDNEFKEER